MTDFAGKIAVITGGGTGMGREMARQLVAEGCSVAMCDVSAENMAETRRLCLEAAPQGTQVDCYVADVSIEGVFTPENDELLLTEYFGSKPDQNEYKHFLANKIYVDYLWTLWAKTRVPYDGQPMEDWAVERYARLKDNLRLFAEA